MAELLPGEIIWDVPPYHYSRERAVPFDFPMGTQFMWQLLGEGSERAFLYILRKLLGVSMNRLLVSG